MRREQPTNKCRIKDNQLKRKVQEDNRNGWRKKLKEVSQNGTNGITHWKDM